MPTDDIDNKIDEGFVEEEDDPSVVMPLEKETGQWQLQQMSLNI